MFKSFASLIQSLQQGTPAAHQHNIELACTTLLYEVVRADHQLDPVEIKKLRELVSNRFSLTREELDSIIDMAATQAEDAVDYYQFTREVNDTLSIKEKIELVTMMWTLAISDGEVDPHEEHAIRRIADLLNLRHSEYIKTKHAALDIN